MVVLPKITSNVKNKEMTGQDRDSNIELFRVIAMLCIVAHHYVVNSGLLELISKTASLTPNSFFLLFFGWGGKTGINCFLVITGWFMCTSRITLKKFLKLFLEVEFYQFVTYIIFYLSGYAHFPYQRWIAGLTPFYGIGTGFTPSYIAFFLFIPFLNILIRNMDKKMHLYLLLLALFIFSVLPSVTIPPVLWNTNVKIGYVGWFMIVYLLAAYIRLYPEPWFENVVLWRVAFVVSLLLSLSSVYVFACIAKSINMKNMYYPYICISDSNKILALVTAVCAFMFFKSLHIGHSKCINAVAASSFGVLLIHTSSATTRQWLWKDMLNNVGYFNADLHILVLHAVISVISVYVIGTVIDMLRIRFIEKPFFRLLEKKKVL